MTLPSHLEHLSLGHSGLKSFSMSSQTLQSLDVSLANNGSLDGRELPNLDTLKIQMDTVVWSKVLLQPQTERRLKSLTISGYEAFALPLDFAARFPQLETLILSSPFRQRGFGSRSVIEPSAILAADYLPASLKELHVHGLSDASHLNLSQFSNLVKVHIDGKHGIDELTSLANIILPEHLHTLELAGRELRSLRYNGVSRLPSKLVQFTLFRTSLTALAAGDLPLSLERLSATQCAIRDIDLSSYTRLSDVDLHNNQVMDVSGDRLPPSLRTLRLSGNPLRRVQFHEPHHTLQKLSLSVGSSSSFFDLANLPGLLCLALIYQNDHETVVKLPPTLRTIALPVMDEMPHLKATVQSLTHLEIVTDSYGTMQDITALPPSCRIYKAEEYSTFMPSREWLEQEAVRNITVLTDSYAGSRNLEAIEPLFDAWIREANTNNLLQGDQNDVEMR